MNIIVKESKQEISQRKLEGYLKLATIIQWGRKSPVKFCERFYGIEFLDNQKYVFMMSWVTPFNVWCQSRNSGKTTLAAPFMMAKSNLIPNFQTYIMSGVGSQAQEAFLKIEKIAKREIASFTGLTDVFYNETVKSAANTDGFTHNPASFQYKLYNGSSVNSLNGAFDNNRSKRSNLNFYDEAGFAPEEMFETSMPFLAQDSNFKLGGDVDISLLPKEFPNQVVAASSASSTDTYFYKLYKDYAKKMILGDKRYFVADINAEIVINATFNGKKYPGLLRQEVIDDAMKKNKEKALREYYNKFSTEGGENQAIKRATIIRNSEVRTPLLHQDGDKKFVLAYDPARSYDNAVCMVGELYYDEIVGYKMRICNGVSFVDVSKKKKTPMRTPEQISHIKQMLLNYNGNGFADYENIEALMIDSGAGGGGHIIADDFMEDWVDNKGIKHKGLIDAIELSDYVNNFPNAADKLKLMNPKKYKNEMFDALVEMLGLDLISFTEEYDMKGHLSIFVNSEFEYEDETKNKKRQIQSNQKIYKLSSDEELALKNIDLAKEEIVNIFRYDNPSGGYRYALSPDKESKMHDDRAYCIAMLAWFLQQKRRSQILNKQQEEIDLSLVPTQVSTLNIIL
ncbi:terminase [Brevibacillus porteri]|uniref:terminase n=1 Tax=Brevibacillus porteri TaxID=2126350 RepID=UPI003636B03F